MQVFSDSNENEHMAATGNNMDDFTNMLLSRRSQTWAYPLCSSIYIKFKNRQNYYYYGD